ncbi:MAG: hypothetical protein ACFFEN_15995 [Candidatus Thorarchaeota archaeon]
MVVITLILTRTYFPTKLAAKVGKKYIEWLKDNPPDNTIEKNICIGVSSTEDGDTFVIGVGRIMKGKEQEALERITKQTVFMASEVEGLRAKNEIILDFTEAYKIIGMDAPEI